MALIWGINFPIIKAVLPDIPPLAFNALRFPLAALTVLIILKSSGKLPKPHRSDWPRVIALGVLGNVAYQGFFIFGVQGTYAGNASILLATTPVWTLILSSVRGHERPGAQIWIGVLATLSGMLLVVLGSRSAVGLEGSTLKGDLLIIGGAITWSIYTVGSRRLVRTYGAIPVTAWTLWVGSLGLVLLGIPSLADLPLRELSPWAWASVGYAGILAIGLAYLLWYRGVQRIGNSRTAAYSNLVPIVALAIAWVWLGEVPSLMQILGATIVLVGLSVARFGKERGS